MPNDVHALCLIFQQIVRPVRSENIKKESQVSYRTVLNIKCHTRLLVYSLFEICEL